MSEDSEKESEHTVEDKNPDWWKLASNAGFTLIGGLVGALATGYYNLAIQQEKSSLELKMEHQKLDGDLIKIALQSPEIEKRKEALTFMAQTGLISDPDIRKGVEAYLAKGNSPPRLTAPPVALQSATVVFEIASADQPAAANRLLVPDLGSFSSDLPEGVQKEFGTFVYGVVFESFEKPMKISGESGYWGYLHARPDPKIPNHIQIYGAMLHGIQPFKVSVVVTYAP